jgi:MFS superfamily sulfate permease-like transporter
VHIRIGKDGRKMSGLIPLMVMVVPVFVLASFTGGIASAIAAGGREEHSIFTNAGIGFLGWLAASTVWALFAGAWPTELHAGLLLLTFGCSIGVARLWDRHHSGPVEAIPLR